MTGRLIGVGVGPGDPELVTVRAVRVLGEAEVVFVPVAASGEVGRAEAVVRSHLPQGRLHRLPFELSGGPPREGSWARCGLEVARVVRQGKVAAFATIGDPTIYSTFTHLARAVRSLVPAVAIEIVPGITAMQDLAARSRTVLAEGAERLALFPLVAGIPHLRRALEVFDTVVCYKGGRQLPELLDVVGRAGRLSGAVYGARLGLAGEDIRNASEMAGEKGPYLSTVIVPARRGGGGSEL